MEYYSQFGEDKWLNENGWLNEPGFYVDVGAGHPYHISNTALLRKLGWTGIAIDADDRWIPYWRGKNLVIAAIATSETVSLERTLDPQLSHCVSGTDIHGVRLDSLLGDKIPDLISIDVEGAESDVWQTLGGIKPKLAIIEYNTLGVTNNELRDKLLSAGYELLHTTPANHILWLTNRS